MIDSHCHLADDVFAEDLSEVVARAQAAGLERALVILEAGHEGEARQATRLSGLWPEVRFAIGVHPHAAHEVDAASVGDRVRAQIAETPGARAVGEIGLDYHYDHSPRETQRAVFAAQLEAALALDLPVVIHTREADADTVDLLRAVGRGAIRGVFHCFTGGSELARAGLDLGLYLSASGILTFPRAGELRDTFALVPLDRLLVETDSPFLAPVPHRGARNEPAHVGRVVETLAGVFGADAGEMRARTTANFHTLFRP